MNRLVNQRAYLAGPMDRCPDRGSQWRDFLTPILKDMGVIVLNPIHKPTDIAKEDFQTHIYKTTLKQQGNYDELSKLMKEIRNVDLRLVDISDFLVVNLDLDIHPCGTLEEIFWANRQKKPIIIHMKQGKQHTPDWLFGTIPHHMIFSSWKEIVEYLDHINNTKDIETSKRWYFFNL